jgi:hypothetical protein
MDQRIEFFDSWKARIPRFSCLFRGSHVLIPVKGWGIQMHCVQKAAELILYRIKRYCGRGLVA